jgi:hypothetical protein
MATRTITINIQPLFEEVNYSNLSLPVVLGAGVINVYNIANFAINQVLCIGEPGSKGSEIIKTHASTAPTGTTVTLASNLTKDHAKDNRVYIINYNQVEYSHADTETGSKSVLATNSIDAENIENFYRDTSSSSGYYFTRFLNNILSTNSAYSDPIPFGGIAYNTVGYAIQSAMADLGAEFGTPPTLTFEKLLRDARQMLRLVRGKMKAWSKYQEYDYIAGTISQGVRRIAVPATLYDKNSNRSVLNVRIGNGSPLEPIDREEYLSKLDEAVYTEVATQAEIAATSLVLDDTSDLDDSGSVDVYVSGTKYTITYTTNTRSTNTLSGIATDQITAILPVDSATWQNVEEGTPEVFNVSDGYLYVWPMISDSYEGRNLFMDFYTDIETIDSQSDVILGTKYDMLIPYLKWKIRAVTENNGKEDMKDPSYGEFRELLTDAKSNDLSAEVNGFYPRNRSVRQTRDNASNHYL